MQAEIPYTFNEKKRKYKKKTVANRNTKGDGWACVYLTQKGY